MIAAIPELSCTQEQYQVFSGSRDISNIDNVLCVGNEATFEALDKIFTEVADLFPHEYIHIGADEVQKRFWNECPKCRKRVATEHLKNVAELQSYFIGRMEKLLARKGKKLIGWEEILDEGLAPESAIMAWRAVEVGKEAAKMKHPVIMTPWHHAYLDLYQGEPAAEPPTYGMCRLTDSYHWDPDPDGVESKYILGGQGNLWTARVPNLRTAQYMTWPRGLALADVYWSPKEKRDWPSFIERMEAHFPRLDEARTKYARSVYNAIVTPVKADREIAVRLSTEIAGINIHYTFDDTDPDEFYSRYEKGEVLAFPKGATRITVVTYRNGEPLGEQFSITKAELKRQLNQLGKKMGPQWEGPRR